jgi:hypothetical protein
MSTRVAGAFAGIEWLKNAIGLVGRRPGALIGAGALMLVVAMVPSLVAMPLQMMAPGNMTIFFGTLALSTIGGLLLAPVTGGYLQVIDKVARDESVRVVDIFGLYRNGGAGRIIGLALVMMIVFLAVFAIVVAAVGTGVWQWYLAMATQSQNVVGAELPKGIFTVFALCGVLGMFAGGVSALAYGQVSLADRSIFGALGDGFAGTLKNVVALVVLLVASVVLGILAAIVIGICFALLALLAKLVGAWLMVLAIPLYLALLLSLYPLMFGVMYYFWRDVCGHARPSAPMGQAIA